MGSLRKKGDRWYFSVEIPQTNGKRKRIERAGGRTKKEAQEKMKIFEAEVLKHGYKEESKMKFEELTEIWLKNHVSVNCKCSTLDTYKKYLKNHIVPELGAYKLTDLKPRIINDFFISFKRENKLEPNTIRTIRDILSSCLSYAVFPLELIDSNPCTSIKLPKMETKKDKKDIITLEDLEKILLYGQGRCNFNEMCILLYNTGLRVSEALALQWSDIDMDEKVIHVKHSINTKNSNEYELTTPKTKTSIRDVYFNNDVEKILKTLKRKQNECKLLYGSFYKRYEHDFIFTNRNGSLQSRNTFANAARSLQSKGLYFSMHTFRHTHATMLLQAGVNMKDVQTRLGHSDISTTMNIYVQSTTESKKKVVEILDEYLKTSDI